MANKLYDDAKIQAIADAIRAKNSSTATYKVGEMAEAITAIPAGGEDTARLAALLSNGAYERITVYDFSSLNISTLREYACYSLQNQQIPNTIILPNRITKINNYTFYSCKYTTNIVLPNTITQLGNSSFAYCSSLALTELPSGITDIGSHAFNKCTNLALTELPSGITDIGSYVFSECSSLALTELPSGITSIGTYAFNKCTDLALTELPSGITDIGSYAFYQCSSLALTELPENITSIGTYAFGACTNLTEVAINSVNLDLTNQNIFGGCDNLKKLKIKAKGISINNAFGTLNLEKVWIANTCLTIRGSSVSNHAFWNNTSFDIYCEAAEKPSAWGTYWFYYSQNYASAATVHFGVTEEEFDALDEETTDETTTE